MRICMNNSGNQESPKPTKENTAIVIVTYNPDSKLIEALNIHKKIVDTIIIIDNNSSNKSSWIKKIPEQTILIQSEKNQGIAWGLNEGICIAIKFNKDFVLTFDQDSIPVENILQLYSPFVQSNIGLIGTSFSTHSINVKNIQIKETLTVITSGCLHNLKAYASVGPYNNELFIDSVDFDYAIRTKMHGYKVLRSINPLIAHRLGYPISKWGIQSSNHSPLRRYYMSRNHVYLCRKYMSVVPMFILKKNYTFLKEFIKIFIEPNKKQKLISIFHGIQDGLLLK